MKILERMENRPIDKDIENHLMMKNIQDLNSNTTMPKALILEDDSDLLEQHREALEKEGILCFPTQYAKEAIALMQQIKSIQFALIDVILYVPESVEPKVNHSEVNGEDLISEPEMQFRTGEGVVREINSKGHDVNFIFITYLPEFECTRSNNQISAFKEVEKRLMRHRGVVGVIHRYQILENPAAAYERIISRIQEKYASPYTPVINGNKIADCSQAVCQVRITPWFQGQKKAWEWVEYGTGWLIAPNIVLSCWHLFDKFNHQSDHWPLTGLDLNQTVISSQAIFEYLEIDQGIEYEFSEMLAWDDELDYTFLRICDRKDDSKRKRSFLPLELRHPLKEETKLLIIQHPQALSQQISLGWQFQLSNDLKKLVYKVATDRGASGAPVIRLDSARVIAMHTGVHHACNLQEGGMMQAIMDDLKQKKPEIYQEIMAYQ